ncbi:uncharacterized protein LOC114334010 [Diabrotica virgifera virgifera]|uniref:Transcription factor Adf-1-like n=1 Tax=Diabrotica virgifera virgifera TaxID=50390 RepID=A0ABM5IRN5_DIAVI|nr:uncharacterized protein LOC114334010 [Diabrotica virgifera virgifera]
MRNEVKLILEIENNDCLYNYKLVEYSRKDITDKAWAEVAENTNSTVTECKERWRNIRSSFLRSLRPLPNGSKPKKSYYLNDYLQFLLPYIRPLNGAISGNVPPSDTQKSITSEDSQIANDEVFDEEPPDYGIVENENEDDDEYPPEVKEEPLAPLIQSECSTTAPSSSRHSQISIIGNRRRKRPISDVEKTFIKYLQNKAKKRPSNQDFLQHSVNHSNTVENPMLYFFKSLLPEFETMTEDEIRSFKIRVMILIDEIKKSNSHSSSSSTIAYPKIENVWEVSNSSL